MSELTVIWNRRSERSLKKCTAYNFPPCCEDMDNLIADYSNSNISFIHIGYKTDIRDTSTSTEGKDETKGGRRKGLFFVIKDLIFTKEGYDEETDYIQINNCPFCGEEIKVTEKEQDE